MAATEQSMNADTEIMRFAGNRTVPIWLACTYLGSNIVLNTLNFYWFGKMIETVKKRFQPQKEKRGATAMGGKVNSEERMKVEMDGHGHQSVMAEKTQIRRRKIEQEDEGPMIG